ncbi:MAG: alpha/beta hydrolase [Sandaracinobacteroides sp.]
MTYIDPAAQRFLDMLALAPPPPPDLAGQRAGFSALWRSMAPPAPDNVALAHRRISSGDHEIDCLVYAPEAAGLALPVILFLHGGGGIMLSPEDFDATSRLLALQAGAIVVAPRYRLAPEHPFPQPLDDCVAVYAWLTANAAAWGADPARIAVVGDSAGGYLAAAVAQDARRRSLPPPIAQVLLYPMLDMAGAAPSRYDRGYFVTDAALKGTIAMHFADHLLNPRASPLREPDLEGLPPALIIVTDLDPLMDEGRAYALRLRNAGVPVSWFCYEGQVHGFFSFGGAMPEGNRCVAHVSGWLRHAFSS